jgi:hypothetical protein
MFRYKELQMKLIATAVIVTACCCQAAAQDGAKRAAIESKNLASGRYVVIGPLGAPLGEVISVSVEAVRREGKGDNELLRVWRIAGKKLREPIEMPYSFWPWAGIESLEEGKLHEIRPYQHGEFSGVPAQVMKETVAVQSHGYTFVTELVVVRSLAAGGGADGQKP